MLSMYVDISEVKKLTNSMKRKLTPAEFDKLMFRTMNEVGRRAKAPIKRAVIKKYEVSANWAAAGIKVPRVHGGGGNVYCDIPLKGPKGHIGGTFAAQGGHYGWHPPKYRISAHIIKGKTSVLPTAIAGQGGQPPFRNMGGGGKAFIGKSLKVKRKRLQEMQFVKMGGGNTTLVMTRKHASKPNPHDPGRFPIKSVAGLALPQMPLNLARPETEDKITELAMKRTIHNFEHLFG